MREKEGSFVEKAFLVILAMEFYESFFLHNFSQISTHSFQWIYFTPGTISFIAKILQ